MCLDKDRNRNIEAIEMAVSHLTEKNDEASISQNQTKCQHQYEICATQLCSLRMKW